MYKNDQHQNGLFITPSASPGRGILPRNAAFFHSQIFPKAPLSAVRAVMAQKTGAAGPSFAASPVAAGQRTAAVQHVAERLARPMARVLTVAAKKKRPGKPLKETRPATRPKPAKPGSPNVKGKNSERRSVLAQILTKLGFFIGSGKKMTGEFAREKNVDLYKLLKVHSVEDANSKKQLSSQPAAPALNRAHCKLDVEFFMLRFSTELDILVPGISVYEKLKCLNCVVRFCGRDC